MHQVKLLIDMRTCVKHPSVCVNDCHLFLSAFSSSLGHCVFPLLWPAFFFLAHILPLEDYLLVQSSTRAINLIQYPYDFVLGIHC